MSPEIIGVIGLVVMVILLFMRMWIGIAMLLVGLVGYAVLRDFPAALTMLSVTPFGQATFYTLTTIPLFVFMGQLLFHANVGKDLYDTTYTWLGQFRGGLVMATVPACAAFGAITGLPTPAAITLGKTALPEMRKYGYSDSLSTGSICASAGLAVLIPPSVPMIIYGILTETSISRLFIAGILPGLLLTVMFMIVIAIITRINPKAAPAGPKTSLRAKFSSLRLVWPAVVLFILVLGGIYLGYITPTEAGAMGAFGACIIAGVFMRRLTFKSFVTSLWEGAGLTAVILLLIMGAHVLGKFLALSGLPRLLATTLSGLDLPTWGMFMMLVLLYIILGMFLQIVGAVIITMPVIFPIVTALGFDPIWFGVIIILLVQMGVLTPPVGMDVFIMSGAVDVPLGTVFKGVAPFVLVILIGIVILWIFPDIALILPRTM